MRFLCIVVESEPILLASLVIKGRAEFALNRVIILIESAKHYAANFPQCVSSF